MTEEKAHCNSDDDDYRKIKPTASATLSEKSDLGSSDDDEIHPSIAQADESITTVDVLCGRGKPSFNHRKLNNPAKSELLIVMRPWQF